MFGIGCSSEGDSLQEARENLKEAVEVYIESVYRDNEEEEFIPRPVPEELVEKYFRKFKELLCSPQPSEFYEFREVACA